jgi:hypothetical protein
MDFDQYEKLRKTYHGYNEVFALKDKTFMQALYRNVIKYLRDGHAKTISASSNYAHQWITAILLRGCMRGVKFDSIGVVESHAADAHRMVIIDMISGVNLDLST